MKPGTTSQSKRTTRSWSVDELAGVRGGGIVTDLDAALLAKRMDADLEGMDSETEVIE